MHKWITSITFEDDNLQKHICDLIEKVVFGVKSEFKEIIPTAGDAI